MPYIKVNTTAEISNDKEKYLKTALGKAIENFPGKSEAWLMTEFSDNCRIYFRGDNSENSAFVEVKLLGAVDRKASEKMSADICKILNESLSVPEDRIYITYTPFECWGWNGGNF